MRPLSVFPFENRPVRKNLQKSSEHRFPETESSVWGQKPPERNNTMKPLKLGLFTLALGASIARASTINLPTPDPSPYPDTESSVNVAVTNWPALGRRVKLTLTANFTPSNCVQIALGQDTDSDGDLAPEETHLVLGIDCTEPFLRNEGRARTPAAPQSQTNEIAFESDCGGPGVSALPTNITTCVFRFKQPSAVAKRVTHVKVTTRGRGNSAAEIAAEITRPGAALILR